MADEPQMTHLIYFAYGSNMSPTQMAVRCPGVRPLGAAVLHNWRFLITKRGTANIERHEGARVYGVLWRVSPTHLVNLDRWEGVGARHYLRRAMWVERLHEPAIRHASAHIYVSMRRLTGLARPDYMLNAVLPGAEAFNLPHDYKKELRSWIPARQIAARVPYRGFPPSKIA